MFAEKPVQGGEELFDPRVRDAVPERLAFATKRHKTFRPHLGQVLGQRRLGQPDGISKRIHVYWSERDDWTLAMVAAGLGFAFMPAHAVKHAGVVALPVIEPEFWRRVNLVTVRGRPYSPGVGALVREAMHKKWFGTKALPRS